jgi:hypothetical protein
MALSGHTKMAIGPFRPGDRIPTTGIYSATHYQHRLPHEVFAVEGDRFPICNRCAERAYFILIHHAIHIASDQDFARACESKSQKIPAGLRKSS